MKYQKNNAKFDYDHFKKVIGPFSDEKLLKIAET
jgi:alpha-glucuronidase